MKKILALAVTSIIFATPAFARAPGVISVEVSSVSGAAYDFEKLVVILGNDEVLDIEKFSVEGPNGKVYAIIAFEELEVHEKGRDFVVVALRGVKVPPDVRAVLIRAYASNGESGRPKMAALPGR